MPTEAGPVLSVIVRRFNPEFDEPIERAVRQIQQAVARQPGFAGVQNSLSRLEDRSELVTVFAFDSRETLDAWRHSDARNAFVRELDRWSEDSTSHTQFGELAQLLSPKAKLRKVEVVAILIFWILVSGSALKYLAALLLPDPAAPFWRELMLVSVNVVLISYVFLPWSSLALTNLKTRVAGRRRKR
jgi:antibiotic biosynthesis monooxygenase (ABM) superfamily enzyme